MESVLISIRPKWAEKIARGEKKIEVRKTAPEETPFKAYIYCAKNFECNKAYGFRLWAGRGKVIGEFVCNYVQEITTEMLSPEGVRYVCKDFYNIKKNDLKKIGLNHEDLWEYGQGKALYGWHISDLKIYDKPKELSEFFKPCSQSKNLDCDWLSNHNVCTCSDKKPITRPPQSYMFVEEVK